MVLVYVKARWTTFCKVQINYNHNISTTARHKYEHKLLPVCTYKQINADHY